MSTPPIGFPAPPRHTPRRGMAALAVTAAVVIVGLVIALVFALRGDDDQPGWAMTAPTTTTASTTTSTTPTTTTPPAISRAELMRRYAELNPFDGTATPEAVDNLALSTCTALAQGTSTDELITALTEIYKANATEVVHLFVSYECPSYLGDFE